MKSFEELKAISDVFFKECKTLIKDYPWMVCIAMHEYYRNLYPADPYITISTSLCHTERLYKVCEYLIKFLRSGKKLGYYPFPMAAAEEPGEVKEKTGEVYGKLWNKFTMEDQIEKSVGLIRDRFLPNGFDMKYLKGKNAIDIGCGSGRFTFALSKLGCANVIGVDYGDRGIAIAREALKKTGIKGVSFKKANVLALPFENESFDFVFCNGVLHHTEDMEKGIAEMIRVAKKGGKLWLYLYADGGIFWYARKMMPKIMKQIPQTYTMKVLDMIGMPKDRFIFSDNWYVPIERHTNDRQARIIFNDLGIHKIQRIEKGRSTDLDYLSMYGGEAGKVMWGDGELRYFLEKD